MKTINKIFLAGILVATGIASIAATQQEASASGISTEATRIDAKALWREDCASCHGRDGKGETRAGRRAGAKDLTDANHQETFSDEQAFKSIKEGLKDESAKELMKPFDDKLTDEEIMALVKYVRKEFDPKHPRDLSEAALKANK